MKQITLHIPENKFQFFIELVHNLGFVKLAENGDSKAEIISNIEGGLKDLQKYKQGKLNTTKARDFLNEI